MPLVLITGDGPEHRFVANAILEAHEVAAILVCDPPPRRSWRQVLRKTPGRFADRALRRLYLRAIGDDRTRRETLHRVLGPESRGFARPELVVRVGSTRGPVLRREVAARAPRIVAVYGTGIVPDAVLAEAREIALNMHTGLSPWYRGTACAFWPIVEGQPEMVGATVHECTAAVDGGRIFFRAPARLYREDNLHAVFARAVRAGAEGYVEVIGRALAGTLSGEVQDSGVGREYRGDMLGLRAELAARRALARMAADWPMEPGR